MTEQKKTRQQLLEELLKNATPKDETHEKKIDFNQTIEPKKPVEINGGDNSVNVADNAKGTINVTHHHKPTVVRNVVKPTDIHITESQAKILQDLVRKAVDIELVAGGESKKMFSKWWKKLKNHYGVSSYKLIPVDAGESAITWMKQQVAILRPKLRRRDNDLWRNEHYAAIYARWRELGYEKSSVYQLVAEKLNKSINSLTELGERDLKKIYDVIMKMK